MIIIIIIISISIDYATLFNINTIYDLYNYVNEINNNIYNANNDTNTNENITNNDTNTNGILLIMMLIELKSV